MNKHSLFLATLLSTLTLAACSGGEGGDDGSPDAACATQTFYPDVDGDGFGDTAHAVDMCTAPVGYIAKGGDCRDSDASSHPGVAELCDSIDNNCDGKIDDADPALSLATAHTYYRDSDGDGFGGQTTVKACKAPTGYVSAAMDCNDTNPQIKPTASEICDQVDNDCDGLVDLADSSLDPASKLAFYRDVDNDQYGTGTATMACVAPTGYVAATGDCNDANATAHPGGVDVCDGADNDCDGGNDGTAAAPNRCTALIGTFTGSYTHHTDERLGSTIINQMNCTGTGSGSLALGRAPGTPALQGAFACVYTGGLGGFQHDQNVTLSASVGLGGQVTGTVHHVYDSFGADRTYNVTGTLTGTTLTLSGTGSWYPNVQSAVAWGVTFSFSATK